MSLQYPGGRKRVTRVPFRLVWASRHLLHWKMTNSFYCFIVFFLVFFNQLSKFLFFCQTIIFFTSNECFSHFNVQQLRTLKHKSFCFVWQALLKITLKTKAFRKIYFARFYWISNTKVRFTFLYVLRFWSETWKSKN